MKNKLYILLIVGLIFESLIMLMHGSFFYDVAERKLQMRSEDIMLIAVIWGIVSSFIVLGFFYTIMFFTPFEKWLADASGRVLVKDRYQSKMAAWILIPLLVCLFIAEFVIVYQKFQTGTFGNPNAFSALAAGIAFIITVSHYFATAAIMFAFYLHTSEKANEVVDQGLNVTRKS